MSHAAILNGDAGHHAHNPHLAHHFHNMEQQHEAAKLGVWLFLVTEVLLFGGLFCFYAIYRSWNPEMFIDVHKLLDVKLGAINTLVLIFSSVTVALAIRSIQLDNPKQSAVFLVITILCAFTFLVIKYFEYSHKFHQGLFPGKYFVNPEIAAANPHIFFSIYFCMTGLHGFHVAGGIVFLGWVLFKTLRGTYSSQYYTPVEMGGLYWHLVDLIWIYLFPLLYLIG
jgi:cytochrome c oxidase subunit III